MSFLPRISRGKWCLHQGLSPLMGAGTAPAPFPVFTGLPGGVHRPGGAPPCPGADTLAQSSSWTPAGDRAASSMLTVLRVPGCPLWARDAPALPSALPSRNSAAGHCRPWGSSRSRRRWVREAEVPRRPPLAIPRVFPTRRQGAGVRAAAKASDLGSASFSATPYGAFGASVSSSATWG